MYALALSMSAAVAAATTGLPYFHLGSFDVGVPIQAFGILVAAGVLIGAALLRRYAEWHGVSDDHIRGLITWLLVSGFLGAHEFDVIAYQWDRIGDATVVQPAGWWFLPESVWPSNWPLVLRIWDGISSYGGFIGGALGFAIYVWWKRLPVRLFADVTIVGLLPAFSIGRLGCTVVSDHIGAAVDLDRWYAFLAMDYPRKLNLAHLAETYPGTSEFIRAWNLGFVEFLYLVPVNLVVLWLAFRPTRRMPAGYVTALTGVLYAPVRFFLDYLRPEDTDPRYGTLTFAQWSSIVAFAIAIYAARRILGTGQAAEIVAPTAREAQARLRIILKEDDDDVKKQEADKKAAAERKKAEIAEARVVRDREDAELAARAAQAPRSSVTADSAAAAARDGGDEGEEDDEDEDAEDAAEARAEPPPTTAGKKAATGKPGGRSSAAKKKSKSRKR
ncbi:MAG TPA: prolipoprotein diacylglyceryl transferase family protein [Kofleriaceae bacterium]